MRLIHTHHDAGESRLDAGARGTLAVRRLTPGAVVPGSPGAETAVLVREGDVRWHDEAGGRPLGPGDGMFAAARGGRWRVTAGAAGATLLLVRGGETAPGTVAPAAPAGRFTLNARPHGDALTGFGGFVDMGVRWLVTAATLGARSLVVATSTFTPGGSHDLHRHPSADEYFLVLSGGGEHLTESGPVPVGPGDLVHVPAGEWHGYRTSPGVVTRTVYGYLGAGDLDTAGYQLMSRKAKA
ncbi:cupin domain-containing protein [Actinoplanes hulinensis]|uniref:Cupin domain-containing protein n=1 Tax=Actinoplanes hulinensis TaxID=1144547 RepID=A0ABS7B1Y4_9ACTN|nr:cupin domain-containing protein [Actinoplanes hulinensis]MBW6434877.1 cupin domain-containing protein [Actinoplanes hulinensis]